MLSVSMALASQSGSACYERPMNHINIRIRTDADVAFADELVRLPGKMRAGVSDAVPQPNHGFTRA